MNQDGRSNLTQQNGRNEITTHALANFELEDSNNPNLRATWTINIRQKRVDFTTEEEVVVKSTLGDTAFRYLSDKHPNAKHQGYHLIRRSNNGIEFASTRDEDLLSDEKLKYGFRAYFAALASAILLDSKSLTVHDSEALRDFVGLFGVKIVGTPSHTPVRFYRSVNVRSNLWTLFFPLLVSDTSDLLNIDCEIEAIRVTLTALIFRNADFNTVDHFNTYSTALFSTLKDESAYKLNFATTCYRVFINNVHDNVWDQIQESNMIGMSDSGMNYPQFNFERTWRPFPVKNIAWSSPQVSPTYNIEFNI